VAGAGDDDNLIMTSHPAAVTIHYRAYRDLGAVSLVLRLIRSDGVVCASLYSRIDEVNLSSEQGNGEISIDFSPLQLFPGSYYAVATLKNKNETIVHDMAYSDWFHVEGNLKGYEDLDAVYEPNRLWTHRSSSSPNSVAQSELGKEL
jgi:hypothetical protein